MDNDWNNWGNDNNQWSNQDDNSSGGLDQLLSDVSESSQQEENPTQDTTVSEPAPEPEEQSTDNQDNQENKGTQEEFSFPENITDMFISTPGNVKSSPAFSERQIYKVMNLLIIMDACREEDTKIIGDMFSLRGTNMRKALNLVELDTADLEDKLMVLTTLMKIRQSATGEGIDDAMDFAISLFARVEALNPEQRAALVSIVKSYQDALGVKKIRSNKSTNTADLIKDVKESMEGEDSISEMVRAAGTIALAVEEAVK